MRTIAPYLRRWVMEQRIETASRFYRRAVDRPNGAAWVLAALLLMGALMWAQDRQQRINDALAHIPSADYRMLSEDYPVTQRDIRFWEQAQRAAIQREWQQIAGSK